jgi:hypothetical protein
MKYTFMAGLLCGIVTIAPAHAYTTLDDLEFDQEFRANELEAQQRRLQDQLDHMEFMQQLRHDRLLFELEMDRLRRRD